MWEHIVEKQGIEKARAIMREEDDFGFIRNYLEPELAEKLGLFVYQARQDGEIKITERKVQAVRESILAPKFNYGAPRIYVSELRQDGTLVLGHDHANDGRGLDLERASRVLQYIQHVWRRPVIMHTIDSRGTERELRVDDS
jgi:stage V sporulation protein R